MEALGRAGAGRRLEWLRNRGFFYHGMAPKDYFYMIPDQNSPTKIAGNCVIMKDNIAN
jgi:hypothetical protein